MENFGKRHFYEIEAAGNDWSLTEFKRPFDECNNETVKREGIQCRLFIDK